MPRDRLRPRALGQALAGDLGPDVAQEHEADLVGGHVAADEPPHGVVDRLRLALDVLAPPPASSLALCLLGHRRRGCHSPRGRARGWLARVVGLGLCLGAAACAPKRGWDLTPQRTCERGGPALVCAEVDPDRPLRFELGGAAIVPGECVASPKGGGLLRVAVGDGRDHATDYRWIRAPRGRVTRVGVRDGKLWLKVEGRDRCGPMPVID